MSKNELLVLKPFSPVVSFWRLSKAIKKRSSVERMPCNLVMCGWPPHRKAVPDSSSSMHTTAGFNELAHAAWQVDDEMAPV